MRPDRQVLPSGRYVIYTGHPPPLLQIAGQVRTPTGFTVGVPSADGPKLIALAFTLQGVSRPPPRPPWQRVAPPKRGF